MWLAYTRVSRVGDRAETLISPSLQLARIESYAAARGLAVEALEPELDVSGGKVKRPILSAAIERVEAGAEGIIVAQLDRLSRMDIADALATIKRIEAAGGQVIAVAENFDASTPEGRLGRNVFLALGEMQLDRYRAQFRAAKRQAVERGIWPTRTVPIGYRLTKGRTLEPGPDAVKVVKAFTARAGGRGWREVGRILDRGPSGAAKVIRNRVYLGELRLTDAVDGEWVNVGAHEPLVARDLWEAAQIAHPRPPRGVHGPALLTGLVRCAGCQRTMSPDSASAERAYRCRAHFARGKCPAPAWVRFDAVDPYVEGLVLAHLKGVGVIDTAAERSDLIAAVDAAEAELAGYQEAVRVSEVGPEHFALGMRQRISVVEQARARASRGATPHVPTTHDLLNDWEGLSVGERAHVLRGALSVVWVRRGREVVGERVRVIDASVSVEGFTGPGRTAPIESIEWPIGPLPGEITGLEDLGEGASGAET